MKRAMLSAMEQERLALQERLDAEKTSHERNRLGQFATPTALAEDILSYTCNLLPTSEEIRFLDPAIGTGAFYLALLKTFPAFRIKEARGFEIDSHYSNPAACFWKDTDLKLEKRDFTTATAAGRFNLLICNPPYVRHHHLSNDDKARLKLDSHKASGAKIGGLSGLYCYFMGLSQAWLADGAISGWLVPSEFMDVNYGRVLKQYLLERVTLLRIHRFDPSEVQFADALVSSAVVWYKNTPPSKKNHVQFTYGGRLKTPIVEKSISSESLREEEKWTRFPLSDVRIKSDQPTISDFFKIKRGLATGDNKYFILDRNEIERRGLPIKLFKPILPSPRYVKDDEVKASKAGFPLLDRQLFLLDPELPEQTIEKQYPALWQYLEEGKKKGLHERYLCRHRSLWYAQEKRPPAPIVCTYLGRSDEKTGRPFRFILNKSQATVANVYLAMYPTALMAKALSCDPFIIRLAWEALNRITPEELLSEGRVYGGGLYKLEPKELANVPVPEIAKLLPEKIFHQTKMSL